MKIGKSVRFVTIVSALVFVLPLLFVLPAGAAFALPSGTPGESPTNPATTQSELEAAIAAATVDDTIYLSGTIQLDSTVDIDTSLTLQGDGQSTTVITLADEGYRHFTTSGSASLTLNNLTLEGINNTTSGGGGVETDDDLVMNDCTVRDCYTDYFLGGAGICVYSEATLSRCTFEGNSADGDAGGVYVGGGATLTDCIFTNNSVQSATSDGGGAYVGGDATVADCTFTGNSAGTSGGGLSAAFAELTNCTFDGNTAGDSGGGLHTYTSTTITNSTLTGNSAGNEGGGLFAAEYATLTNCTVADNSAVNSGGGLVVGYTADIKGSIVAGNAASSGANVYSGGASWPDTNGVSTDGNYNIIGGDAAALTALFGTNALADNGGLTQTILILAGSLAYDAIPTGTAWLPANDQRGIVRPFGAGGDIGAVELDVTPGSGPPTPHSGGSTGGNSGGNSGGGSTLPGTGDTSVLLWAAVLVCAGLSLSLLLIAASSRRKNRRTI